MARMEPDGDLWWRRLSHDEQFWICHIIVRSCCDVVTHSQRNFLYQIFARTDAQGHYRPETTFATAVMKMMEGWLTVPFAGVFTTQ